MDNIIRALREQLKPRGTAPIVTLELNSKFFNEAFINQCIDETEKIPMMAALGETPSALEKLAITLLCDSVGIDLYDKR